MTTSTSSSLRTIAKTLRPMFDGLQTTVPIGYLIPSFDTDGCEREWELPGRSQLTGRACRPSSVTSPRRSRITRYRPDRIKFDDPFPKQGLLHRHVSSSIRLSVNAMERRGLLVGRAETSKLAAANSRAVSLKRPFSRSRLPVRPLYGCFLDFAIGAFTDSNAHLGRTPDLAALDS